MCNTVSWFSVLPFLLLFFSIVCASFFLSILSMFLGPLSHSIHTPHGDLMYCHSCTLHLYAEDSQIHTFSSDLCSQSHILRICSLLEISSGTFHRPHKLDMSKTVSKWTKKLKLRTRFLVTGQDFTNGKHFCQFIFTVLGFLLFWFWFLLIFHVSQA